MENWRDVWRRGFAPILPTNGLIALREGLLRDDPQLLQGATTQPPPLAAVQDWPVEGACPVTYCGWKGEGKDTVGGAEEFFGWACFEADQLLGEPAASRWFLNWIDDSPRDEVRWELLAEVELTLKERGVVEQGSPHVGRA